MTPFKVKTQDQYGRTISHYLEGEFYANGRLWIYQDRKFYYVVLNTLSLPKIIEGTARSTVIKHRHLWVRQVRRRSKFPGTPHPRKPVWYYVDDPLGRMISVNEG